MHRWFALLTLVLCPCWVAAQEKSNTLTPKEVADGWLLLFDGETPFGWRVEGDAKVDKGILILDGRAKGAKVTTTSVFRDYQVGFNFRWEGQKPPVVRHYLQHPLEAEKAFSRWHARVHVDGKGICHETVEVSSFGQGRGWARSSQPRVFPVAQPLAFEVPAGTKLYLHNVKLLPKGTQSLFNGKDLTGWKVFPGKKSQFSVTDKGEINVKDGPGDLQTAGKFADFLLQLECISHGKHLNSGVFFRCRAGEYQNGYEAQIRNQFTPEPTQEYTLEEYDPLTHKLTGKKKVKSPAVDFGTGAIYRRQPARRAVARDGEWFTLTVLAHDNHFATWVNGIPVTDWTDHRPPSDNARTGCRLAAGHFSLQGHDPTTNLSFRNFRIAAYPSPHGKKKPRE